MIMFMVLGSIKKQNIIKYIMIGIIMNIKKDICKISNKDYTHGTYEINAFNGKVQMIER